MPSRSREEASERHTVALATVERHLSRRPTLLQRPKRPARTGRELLERGALRIEGAHIAPLHGLAIVVTLEPAQRKTLRTADVGPMLVDAAFSALVEERTRPFVVRSAGREQLAVMTRDHRGLD